jgi:hypothetical protein
MTPNITLNPCQAEATRASAVLEEMVLQQIALSS